MPRTIALLLLATGAVFLGLGFRQSSRARAARGFTRTTARVLESRVEQLDAADEQRRERFGFTIRYAYDARGATRESTQVWIGSSAASASDDPAWARQWVSRFPAGAEVPAWFDPADPREAVLVRDVPGGQIAWLLGIGAALAAIGFLALARTAR